MVVEHSEIKGTNPVLNRRWPSKESFSFISFQFNPSTLTEFSLADIESLFSLVGILLKGFFSWCRGSHHNNIRHLATHHDDNPHKSLSIK